MAAIQGRGRRGGLHARCEVSAWTDSRKGASASRRSAGRQMPAGRSGERSSASPRLGVVGSGTGCSRQIVASSPRTACAARTGSSREVRIAEQRLRPGSGSSRSTLAPALVVSVAAGGGAKSLSLRRSLDGVGARPGSWSRLASPAASTESWSKASAGRPRDRGIGWLTEDPLEGLVADLPLGLQVGSQAGEDSSAGSLGAANGIACSRDLRRSSRSRRSSSSVSAAASGCVGIRGNGRPVAPLVSVRRLPELVEGGGRDDQVECGAGPALAAADRDGARPARRPRAGIRASPRIPDRAGCRRARTRSGVASSVHQENRRASAESRTMWTAAVVIDRDRSGRRSAARSAAG